MGIFTLGVPTPTTAIWPKLVCTEQYRNRPRRVEAVTLVVARKLGLRGSHPGTGQYQKNNHAKQPM